MRRRHAWFRCAGPDTRSIRGCAQRPALAGCLVSLLVLCAASSAAATWQRIEGSITGELRVLTVFACFREEAAQLGRDVPGFAWRLFAEEHAGSLSHFYREMSRGQYTVGGDVHPTWIAAPRERAEYLPPRGNYGMFVRDILEELDAQADLGQYDHSGDGFVDFLFVVTHTAPEGFIRGTATGVAGLGLGTDFISDDLAPDGGRVRVRSDVHPRGAGGTIQRGHTFELAAGSMAHELGHILGLPDLYDRSHVLNPDQPPERDSAGVGYWCLMGHGTRGWDDRGGPNPFSAWSLKKLGWLGPANSQLHRVTASIDSAVLADVNAGGTVYKLPIRGDVEYLLVESRMRANSYYERNLPAEGVLIWHVNEDRIHNDDEQNKLVNLVCADGLYHDAGYPAGQRPAPFSGRDNLDFWARDTEYREMHQGNLGDATDVWDGQLFSDYWALSNPAAPPGLSVTGIRRDGDRFLATLRIDDHRRAGPIWLDDEWSGEIEVVGDVTVTTGTRLHLHSGVRVRFGPDGLSGGMDAERSELIVRGELMISGREPVHFTSASADPAPGDWYGIRWESPSRANLHQAVIQYPVTGFTSIRPGVALDLRDIKIRSAAQDGIHIMEADRTVRLTRIQVHDSGGHGVFLHGTGPATVTDVHLAGNARGGLMRVGGALECTDSRFDLARTAVDTAANISLGANVFGSVQRNRIGGGIGIRCAGTRVVLVSGNRFIGNRVGVMTLGSSARISSNIFERSQLVFENTRSVVLPRVDLNVVEDATELVVNHGHTAFVVTNNWWGTTDEQWIAARMTGEVAWQPYLNFDPRVEIHFELEQNYPNPFGSNTTIPFSVGVNELVVTGRARTVLEIRDITGALVKRLIDAPAAPGLFSIQWDGRNELGRRVASGVYYYELQVGPIVQRRKLLLLR